MGVSTTKGRPGSLHITAMRLDRILLVLGTRPEAIKLAPVISALKASRRFSVNVCVTAQHRQMLDQVLAVFGIVPDFDLDLMKPDQKLEDLTATMISAVTGLYRQIKPDLVMVQGDTTTTFAASLASFHQKIPVAHIEAGLRTHQRYSPWPEEINRCLTTVLASWHFAPTEESRANLLAEGVDVQTILVTGNTVVDALLQIVSHLKNDAQLTACYNRRFSFLDPRRRLVLVTGHRRENFGDGLERICGALRELAQRDDVEILYPLHLNPNVRACVEAMLGQTANIHLIEPQEYVTFTYLLSRCHIILTDSGGIQEEAPILGKPVLLMRETTERPEAVRAGAVELVGTDVRTIVKHANRLLDDPESYDAMARPRNLFGDGCASWRIVRHLESLQEDTRKNEFLTNAHFRECANGKLNLVPLPLSDSE
jgi:UDP-N-acetylglucosamine 2-epimerase (non-hydrolysing)